MVIALAQINTIALDIEYNAKKALEYIDLAKSKGADTIIFPIAYLCGGEYFDVLDKFPIIHDNVQTALKYIAQKTSGIKIIMGFINNGSNKVAILENGKIAQIVSSSSEIIDINGIKTSITHRHCSNTHPPKEAQLIIDFTPSISKKNGEIFRSNVLSLLARLTETYVIHINKVGANDDFSYDGSSRVYAPSGKLIARAEYFKEDLLILNDFKGDIKAMPKGIDEEPENSFSLDYENDLERTYLSVCQATRDYFNKNNIKRAVLGLSGGLDSTICAVILTDVLGKDNVLGVSMPSKITSDLSKQDAFQLAQNLGIEFREVPISPMVEAFKSAFKNINWKDKCQTSYTLDNFQARTRATILFGISNKYKSCIPIATSDKSEAYMGYATINGDMSGGFAPIADITKTKLFALAKWLNENRTQKNAIPMSIINKRPGAELAINPKTGKPLLAEEALMPYDFLDEVIFRIEILNQSKETMLSERFVYEKNNTISQEQKSQWIEKFLYRMQSATSKGNLMPVFPIIDEISINKKVFKSPITAKINFESIKL